MVVFKTFFSVDFKSQVGYNHNMNNGDRQMSRLIHSFSLEFNSAKEAKDHLEMLGYRRAPIKGLIQRFEGEMFGDKGEHIVSLASTGFQFNEDNQIVVNFADYEK